MNLQEIKSRTDIVKLACDLGLDIKQTPTGGAAYCPFCSSEGSNHRHLSLHSGRGVFRCVKCQAAGDQITLIHLVKNVSVSDAIKSIQTGWQGSFPSSSKNSVKRPIWQPKQQMPLLPPIHQGSSEIYELLVTEKPISNRAYDYLHVKRGLSRETIAKSRITSIDDPGATFKMLRFNHTDQELKAAGLISQYEKFIFGSPCVLFPHLEDGIVTYLSTRNLDDSAPKSFKMAGIASRPYIGSGIAESDTLIVFEGIINALSYEELSKQGNFIAMMGTISPQQYKQIQAAFPDKDIWLALDPDKAGRDATQKIPGAKPINWLNTFNQFADFDVIPVHDNGKEWDMNDLLIHHQYQLFSISGRNINDGMTIDEADNEAKMLIFKQ